MTHQRVLYVSPEVNPFLKLTSGAEICAGLPKFIKEYGHEIRVIMPKYKVINDHKFVLRDVIRLKEVPVTVNGVEKIATVKSSFIPDSKVQIYFVEIPGFYTDTNFLNKDGSPKPDALLELAFFSKAVLELLKILCWYPHLLHTNEWQSGLIHYYLKNQYNENDDYNKVKTIHSIHNLNQHGVFSAEEFSAIGLPENAIPNGSLLKYAIEDCSVLTLDNEESLMIYEEDEFYTSLHHHAKLEIVPHGYDDLVWNPQAKKMKQVYTSETIEQKSVNKKYLTHKKDLEYDDNIPVVVINIDKDFEYLGQIESWVARQSSKGVYFVLTSLDKDINRRFDDYDLMGDNYVFLRSSTNDDLKNYIAASEFYINMCNRSFYNYRFAISTPFGTIPAGQRSQFVDQFVSFDEDAENFNSVLVDNIKDDFDELVDRLIHVYHNADLPEVGRRLMSMLISWTPSGMRIGKIYDNLID
jgi:starch synthase